MSKNAVSRNIKNAYGEIEPWSGAPLNLVTWSYTANPNTVRAGVGVETAQDWTNARRSGWAALGTDGSHLERDDNYIRHIFGAESINIVGALSLAKAFDFGRYESIFEIGCGDMAQAYVIHSMFPRIRYLATDLDPYVIEKCSRLRLLNGIEKQVLDVLSIPDHDTPFAGYSLLMSWGMEYALDDTQLLKLFQMVHRAGIPFLMCSASTIGLFQFCRERMKMRKVRALIEQRSLRMTGWRRSIGTFRTVARKAKLKIKPIGRFGYHFCFLLERSD